MSGGTVPGSAAWWFEEEREYKLKIITLEGKIRDLNNEIEVLTKTSASASAIKELSEKLKKANKEVGQAKNNVYLLTQKIKKLEGTKTEDKKTSQNIVDIPIDDIHMHPKLVYHEFETYQSDAEASLANQYTQQHLMSGNSIEIPIIVATIESETTLPGTENTLYLIAGKRRTHYAQHELGLQSIPCIVKRLKTLAEALELNYRENFDRIQMSWFELSKILYEFRSLTNSTLTQVGEKFNLSVSYVSRLVSVYEFLKKNPEVEFMGNVIRLIQIETGIVKLSFPYVWDVFQLKKKKEEDMLASVLSVLNEPTQSVTPAEQEMVSVPEAADTLNITESDVVELSKKVKGVSHSVSDIPKVETGSSALNKAMMPLEYFEIPLSYLGDAGAKLCKDVQLKTCPLLKLVPEEVWKCIEEIKSQKEGLWINITTEQVIAYGTTTWVLQKVHELRKTAELTDEQREQQKVLDKQEKESVKIFQEKYMKVKLQKE